MVEAHIRFFSHVDFDGPVPPRAPHLDPCWLWTASTNDDGYGNFWNDGKCLKAHRWSYAFFIGPVPDGLDVDHLCFVRNCIRPDHFEAVTERENLMRSSAMDYNRVKVACPQGHPYDYIKPNGGRACVRCNTEAQRRRRARKVMVMPEFTPIGKTLRCSSCGVFVAVDPQLHVCNPITVALRRARELEAEEQWTPEQYAALLAQHNINPE